MRYFMVHRSKITLQSCVIYCDRLPTFGIILLLYSVDVLSNDSIGEYHVYTVHTTQALGNNPSRAASSPRHRQRRCR
jgi:hypothetical protein